MADTCRMSVELTPGERERLDRLVAQTEARSRTEVICRAIMIYHRVVVEEGCLLIRNRDGQDVEVFT